MGHIAIHVCIAALEIFVQSVIVLA
jgi:hypothetical protein